MKIGSKIAYAMIFLALVSPFASAGLGVSGAIIERKVDPGDAFAHEMIISSDFASPPMDLAVDIMGINQTPDGESVELAESEDAGPFSARTFLKVNPSAFHLEPGQSQNVIVEAKIPQDARPGGRYALINIHSRPIGNGTVGIVVAIEVPVRLTISGPGLMKAGMIEDLKLEESISARQQYISLILRNTGNCHYKAIIHAVLKDLGGNVIAEASSPVSSNIIAGASRIFRMAIAAKGELRPGAYLANATASLSSGSILDSKEIEFKI